MVDGVLTFEHGQVQLGDQLLPGILKSQSIRGSVRFDSVKQENVSGKSKTPLGWDDSDISLAMTLLSDDKSTCYAKLKAIDAIFKGYDNGGNPNIYTIVNAHVKARGIETVVFAGLSSEESEGEDIIDVTLSFTEHEPPILKPEKEAIVSDAATGGAATPTTTASVAADSAIMTDTASPFGAGFSQGAG